MLEKFRIAGGTVLGRNHKDIGKNNQDFYTWDIQENEYIIGLVCDGCSSGMYSEVGANLGAKIIRKAVCKHSNWLTMMSGKTVEFLELVRHFSLTEIHVEATILSKESIVPVIQNYFLFTVIGFIMTNDKTIVFSIGDGVAIVNGQKYTIGPFANNAPPYMAYTTIKDAVKNYNEDDQHFKIIKEMNTCDVESILIGTDGITDLCNAENLKYPGREEKIGPISNFWSDASYFSCQDKIRRKLNLMNRDVIKIAEDDTGKPFVVKHHGILPDDTTMVVVSKI